MYFNDSIIPNISPELQGENEDLLEIPSEAIERNKKYSLEFGDSLERLGLDNKSQRVKTCGNHYSKVQCPADGAHFNRVQGYFCEVRLCPTCQTRRSHEVYHEVLQTVHEVLKKEKLTFTFLTLTVPNVQGDKLKDELDRLFYGFKMLVNTKIFKYSIKGFFRALEVTYDHRQFITSEMFALREKYYTDRELKAGDKNPNYDTFHPHFHILLAVPENYFEYWCPACQGAWGRIQKDKRYKNNDTQRKAFEEDRESRRFVSGRKKIDCQCFYIPQNTWGRLWKQSLNVIQAEYLVTDIRKVKQTGGSSGDDLIWNYEKAVAEIAKYTVKPSQYIYLGNPGLTDKIVSVLENCLAGRRLIGYGGILKNCLTEVREAMAEKSNDEKQKAAAGECPVCGALLEILIRDFNIGLSVYEDRK